MTLFKRNGHLTEEGLCALANGELDEPGRFEAAEHMGFCQPCTQRFLAMMGEGELLSPPKPLWAPVLRRVRLQNAKRALGRYGVTAVAAIAVLVWVAGASALFGLQGGPPAALGGAAPGGQARESAGFVGWAQGVLSASSCLWPAAENTDAAQKPQSPPPPNISPPRAAPPVPVPPPAPARAVPDTGQRRQREAVFEKKGQNTENRN